MRIDFVYSNRDELTTITRYSDLAGTQVVGTSVYSFDASGQLTNLLHKNGSGTPLANYTYTYDAADRVLTEKLNGTPKATYTYDLTDQLTGDGTNNYSYDSNGNRTMTGYQTGMANRLTNDGTWTYTYDSEGNLTQKSKGSGLETWYYGYDNANSLTSVRQTSNGSTNLLTVTYTYDVLGDRVQQDKWKSGGSTVTTRFAYDGSNVWADLDGSNALQVRYLNGDAVDQVLARIVSTGQPNAGVAWYLPDHLGSVRDLENGSTQTVADHVDYDGFGTPTESSPSYGDRYKFTGREYDSDLGIYYYRARYYSPPTGRFGSEDPDGFTAGDANLYRYVANNPANAVDPSGQFINLNAYWFSFWAPIHMQIVADTAADASEGRPDWKPPIDLLNEATNFCAGFSDGATAGLTSYLRRWMGTDQYVDQNSGTYTAGQVTGVVTTTAIGVANPCGVAGLARPGIQFFNGVQAVGQGVSLVDNVRQGNWGSAAFNALGLRGNLSQLKRTCFAAGTPLLTPTGDKLIEEFKPGDLVLSAHEDDPAGPIEPKRVEEVFVLVAPILELRVGDIVIETTAEHPFWVEGRGWVGAGLLLEGDRLRSHNGVLIVVGSISATRKVTTVYNVGVADYHTYFVGSRYGVFSVWAHNGPPCVPPQRPAPKPGLPNEANVVRGGIQKPAVQTHPSGVQGVSVESAPGLSVPELAKPLPNGQIRTTTVGQVRQAGGDVIPTSGRSPNHATLTGLTPDEIQSVLSPPIPNPARAPKP